MLNIRDLKIDTASLGKPLLLVEVRPYSEYKDGKALEGIAGYRYDVCLVAHRLEKLGIKIAGPQLMESPEDGAVEVEFSGLEVRAYQERDEGKLGAVISLRRASPPAGGTPPGWKRGLPLPPFPSHIAVAH